VRLGVSQVDWYLWFAKDYDLLGMQLHPGTPGTLAAWQWTHEQLVGASMTACAKAGDAVVCGFRKGAEEYVLAYSLTGIETQVTVPAGLTQSCGIEGTCTEVSGNAVTVGFSPLRIS
jgi:hypothetical protein